jgi:hypothetical protein
MAFYARTDRDASGFLPVLRREMSAIDPNSAGLTAMALSGHLCLLYIERLRDGLHTGEAAKGFSPTP